jgi:CMP-N,N'-diacetyllegionaminic acid synthase
MDINMKGHTILAVIPARGGSKGVPHKNIRIVGGKPLMAYTIELALAMRNYLHRVIVSTDDTEIARIAEQYGAEAPFLRPPELAGDHISMVPVLQHAVRHIEQQDGIHLDWILLLQPTVPFRSQGDIQEVLGLGQKGGCDSVISVVQVFATHPILMKRIEKDLLLPYCIEEEEGTRRQDYQPPAYMRNGAFYLTRRDILMVTGSIWGQKIRPYVMPPERSVNIDSEMDLKLVEAMLREKQEKSSEG